MPDEAWGVSVEKISDESPSYILSFNKYLLNTVHLSGTVPNVGDIKMNNA